MNDFRLYPRWSRFKGVDTSDPYRYSKTISNSDIFQPLWDKWKSDLSVPFLGITNDGSIKEGLYALRNEGAPSKEMVSAAHNLVTALSVEEKKAVLHDLDSEDWRKWSNPEVILFKPGIRLEHLTPSKISLIWELVKQSLSPEGYDKVRAATKTNRFLGEICAKQAILNEDSYFFTLFGNPSETTPWAYMLFGHHLCLNVFIIGQQLVVGPVFLGAEPCVIDSGPDKGVRVCAQEEELGLMLMRSLSPDMRQEAQTYCHMHDPAMPVDRWHPADQRHLGGAFQDNRVIPYEGIRVTQMTLESQNILMSLIEAFLVLLPSEPRRHRLRQIRSFLSETYFSWIGGYGSADPFYYRVQSPVLLLEFDHHSGVFLTNDEPAKYHIHTIQLSVTYIMSDPPDPRTGRAPPRARRVGRACDYCRRKRLKCTPNQRPCFNCQLYDVDCTSKDLRRRPYPQLTRDEPPSEQPAIYNDQNSASLIEEPSVVPAVDSRIPLTGDCDDNSRNDHQLTPSSWSQGPDLSTGIGNSTQDFDTVLRDLGIGFSSDFWDMDRTMATSLSETCGDFAQPTVAVDSVGTDAGVAKDGLTQLRVNADAFSPSSKLPARRAGGRVSNIESLIGADVHPANVQTSVPPGLFVRKNEVVANYIGFNSVGATLALCLKDALDSQNLPLKATSLGFLIEAGPHVDEVGLTSMVDTSLIDLPPHEVAMHAIEAFMRNLNVFYPIVEEESYRTRSQMFYTAERPQLHTMDYALFFLVLSIGALSETHSGGRSEDMEQLSTGAYHQAWTLMQDSIASPTETSLQILLLYVIHHLYHGKCGIAWVFCGLAIRIAQSLGLHRKIPQEMELSLNHERLRSRLWWIVFCFDANLSLSQGRPPGVTDATYETAPVPPEPTDLSSDDGDENGQPLSPRLPQIYTWMRRLGQIQNEFCNTMHLNTTAGARLDVIGVGPVS
ncbi:DUF3500-domain-containing protein [Aspergillus terreus]|uniref:DUF3500-domain-containing protein n=1 Tax=Aspergillus terreus TaxID=33178 RepID=A0A5M3YPP2_ASPTE|nr:hypothetical protein ATETN484_0002065500 [Aspergillus terreus]GFF15511.1 DUF3500-domain-containing protein [Aspergillus terreus]